MSDSADEITRLTTNAEEALAQTWNAAVKLGEAEVLREGGRNRVLRCPVVAAPDGSPVTVIVKASIGTGEEAFTPDKDTLGSTAWRFYNECAGTALVGNLDALPPLGAALYAADSTTGLLVTEDLGGGACLADRMQGTDRGQLETGLFAYARSMGRLHGATIGRELEFTQYRQDLGGRETEREREGVRWLRENVAPFGDQCAALGVELARGFEGEVMQVQAALDAPGPFLAFAPCDTCPDNNRILSDDAVRFFDFEFCGFRHALLDAAYLRAPFPTCWCANRLPPDLVPRLEEAYRAELVQGCPEAGEDGLFFPALVQAGAYWAIASVSWNLDEALKEDGPWGIATNRQRPPLRLANFAEVSEQYGVLPAIGATARSLEAKLRTLWADSEEMPLYPPFR